MERDKSADRGGRHRHRDRKDGLLRGARLAYRREILETDSGGARRRKQFTARRAAGRPLGDRIVPERYRLKTPASPHYAALIDGVRIAADKLDLPDTGGSPLVIEGSGGLLVPLDEYHALYRRLCAVAASGRALRAHGARYHQSFAAVDRGVAASQARYPRDRLHWRKQCRKRAHHLRNRTGKTARTIAPAFPADEHHIARRVRILVQLRRVQVMNAGKDQTGNRRSGIRSPSTRFRAR